MDDLIKLSDELNIFATLTEDGKRKCHGCSQVKKASELNRCAKCTIFCYCDKVSICFSSLHQPLISSLSSISLGEQAGTYNETAGLSNQGMD